MMPRTNTPSIEKDLFIGGDPGKSGCFSVINLAGEHQVDIRFDWEPADIGHHLRQVRRRVNFCILEKVHSGVFDGNRKAGVKSMFSFGEGNGMMWGMITVCNIRHEFFRPMEWQTFMNCRTKGDKHVSKAKAQQMFPEVKVTLRNADALLMAEMARRTAKERGWA